MTVHFATFNNVTLQIWVGSCSRQDFEQQYSLHASNEEVTLAIGGPYEPAELYVDAQFVLRRKSDNATVEVAPLTDERLNLTAAAVMLKYAPKVKPPATDTQAWAAYSQARSRVRNVLGKMQGVETIAELEALLVREKVELTDGDLSTAQAAIKDALHRAAN